MDTKTDQSSDQYKPKNLQLRGMPEDVYKILLDKQAVQKKKCSCQFSLEQTVYQLIRKSVKKEGDEIQKI